MSVAPPQSEQDADSIESDAGFRPQPSRGRLDRILRPVRIGVGVVLFALVAVAAARGWGDVRDALARIAPFELALAGILALTGLAASVLTWQVALRELGSRVRLPAASKIYLVGQLGKYLPGSVWALAVQMELAREAGVPRARGMAASLVAIGLNVATGLAIGLALTASAFDAGAVPTVSAIVAVVACVIVLCPPVLARLVGLALRLVGDSPPTRRVSWSGMLTATGWSVVSWVCYGTSLWILAVAVGAPAGEAFLLCLGGMALSMTLGFLVVVAPSGIGVREAVMLVALSGALDRPEALTVALVARVLFTLADLASAVIVLPVRIRPPGVG